MVATAVTTDALAERLAALDARRPQIAQQLADAEEALAAARNALIEGQGSAAALTKAQDLRDALVNTSTAPHNLRLALGNPDHQLDELHQFCRSPGVVSVRISALDHPNVVTQTAEVVPGAVAQASIDRRRAKYGEESPLYQSRVRGVSPSEATDALIKLAWLKAAVRKSDADKQAARALAPAAAGLDVANSENGDEAALVLGTGALLESCEAWPCKDANALYRERIAPRIGPRLAANRVGIDGVGVGAGSVNEARRLNHPVVSLIAARRRSMSRARRSSSSICVVKCGGLLRWSFSTVRSRSRRRTRTCSRTCSRRSGNRGTGRSSWNPKRSCASGCRAAGVPTRVMRPFIGIGSESCECGQIRGRRGSLAVIKSTGSGDARTFLR